jgi:glycosyltransferase involved in cell wall biosynthesis
MRDFADAVIANSQATADAFSTFIDNSPRRPQLTVAHLGTQRFIAPEAGQSCQSSDRPYFLCVGTIEPRKNHLLLFNLWRRLAETREAHEVPRLLLVGRRGWENENAVDMLERCDALRGHVEECGSLSDRALQQLMSGARALLMPSFAEGFGMPVAEALQSGLPVLCSDLPALREASGGLASYLDPLDGIGWMNAILDYSRPQSPLRTAQVARIKGWSGPSWAEHIEVALSVIDGLKS